MEWKIILSLLFFVLVIFLFVTYLIFPQSDFYVRGPQNNSFPSYVNNSNSQFYPNLRFPEKQITYSIDDACSLKKKNSIEDAFTIIENNTVLSFYYLKEGGQIKVDCTPKDISKPDSNGFFVAGEGGPTNITITSNFYVINNGKILLIRESKCPIPNVEIHELLHVLGFKHSSNPDSIMYEVSRCSQVITEDIINETNRLYSFPSLPDLAVENFTAQAKGRSIELDFNVINEGLKKADISEAIVYINDQEFKKYSLNPIDIGYGTIINVKTAYFLPGKINKIGVEVISQFSELDKKNNKLEIEINS